VTQQAELSVSDPGRLAPAGPAPDTAELVRSLTIRGEALLHGSAAAEAVECLRIARMLAGPGDDRPARLLNRAIRQVVPRWHFAMMNDHERNAAYEEAIIATVRPGDVVLDIGTGSGLLALLAAKAGASKVITCEAEPVIAAAAQQIVRANGYADTITVLNARSTTLRVGVDLPTRADVLVTEIFDCALLGEHALPALEHARRELLTPDARLVPRHARLLGQLVESDRLRAHNNVSVACGFDVSSFNQFRSTEYFSTYLHSHDHRMLTAPFELLKVDFATDLPAGTSEVSALPVSDGMCDAVAMWFELDLAPGVSLSNGPHHRYTHWRQAVQTFDTRLRCEAGLPVALNVAHDQERVHVRTCSPTADW
jgi:protein arginine N-methyltransferase 7